MKIFLNSNFEIVDVKDKLEDLVVKGSSDFDFIGVYLPTEAISNYTSIYPKYSVRRADNREIGAYPLSTADTSESGYYGWKGTFHARDIAVAGALEITISFVINSNKVKTVAKVTCNVADGVEVENDIYIIGNSEVSSMLDAIDDLAESIADEAQARSEADADLQAQINQKVAKADIVDNLTTNDATKVLSAKQGKVLKDRVEEIAGSEVLKADIVDNLNSDDSQKVLSAKMGKKLQDEKQPLIDSSNKLSADLVDDSETTNKFVTASDKATWNGKQDALTFDSTPTADSDNPVKSGGVYSAIQNVMEVAEGKTRNYVISDALSGSGYYNTFFNSALATISITIENSKIKDINGNDVYINALKIGDIISIVETDVPDRWVGSITSTTVTFYILETKLDITNAVTQNDARPVTSGAVYTALHEDIGYVELSISSSSLTDTQIAEIQKKYCIIKFSGATYYKCIEDYARTDLTIFQSLSQCVAGNGQISQNFFYIVANTTTSSKTYGTDTIEAKSWLYTYSDINFYSKSQADTLLAGKQDTIADIATIRSNASNGQTAYETLEAVDITDSGTSYTATVPSSAKGLATLGKVGGMSYKINQLVQNGNFADGGDNWNTSTAFSFSGGKGIVTNYTSQYTDNGLRQTIPLVANHKYLLCATITNTTNASETIVIGQSYGVKVNQSINANTTIKFSNIYTITTASYALVTFGCIINTPISFEIDDVMCFDLTAMGIDTTSVETAQAELLKRGIDITTYNEYNAGSIRDSAVTSIVSKSRNIWDEQWELGSYDSNGLPIASVNTIRNKNTINVLPNTTYYGKQNLVLFFYNSNNTFISSIVIDNSTFTTPIDCSYINFRVSSNYGTTYNNNICINVSDSENGTYTPYKVSTYPIASEIQALEGYGWGVNDTCYNYIDFERKVFVQKVGRVDLGSLNWSYEYGRFNALPSNNTNYPTSIKYVDNNQTLGNLLCANYVVGKVQLAVSSDKTICIGDSANVGIVVYDSSYTDATAFKSAMSGVYLYYELATPIETDISSYLGDKHIPIEANGSLTFTNTYNQAVPSTITFDCGLVEVVKTNHEHDLEQQKQIDSLQENKQDKMYLHHISILCGDSIVKNIKFKLLRRSNTQLTITDLRNEEITEIKAFDRVAEIYLNSKNYYSPINTLKFYATSETLAFNIGYSYQASNGILDNDNVDVDATDVTSVTDTVTPL